MKKLNCNIGNYQCGGKCQSNKNKCYNFTEKLISSKIDLIVNSLNKILKETIITNKQKNRLTDEKKNKIIELTNKLTKKRKESKNFFLISDLVSELRIVDEINKEFFGEEIYNKSKNIIDDISERYSSVLNAEKNVSNVEKKVSNELEKLGFKPFQLILFDEMSNRGLKYESVKKEYSEKYLPKIAEVNKEINSLKESKKSIKRGDPKLKEINSKIKELESKRSKIWADDKLAYSILSFFKVDLQSDNPKFGEDISQEKLDKAVELSTEKKIAIEQLKSAKNYLYDNLDNLLKTRYNLYNNYNIEPVKRNKENINPIILERGLPLGTGNNPIEDKLQEMVDSRVPMMAIGLESLLRVINDGIFKHAFDYSDLPIGIAGELTKEEFQKYLELRIKVANEKLNIPISASADEREIYGFMGNNIDLPIIYNDHRGEDGGIKPYGNIIIEFKSEVKDDLTVTIDDSLGLKENAAKKASPANNVSIESLPVPAYNNLDAINLNATNPTDLYSKDIYYDKNNSDDLDEEDWDFESGSTAKLRIPRYIEWQSARRLNLNDIKGIIIPINILATIPDNILDKLEIMGIKITIVGAK